MVTIKRLSKPGQKYRGAFGTIPLKEVAVHARPMDDKYIDSERLFVSKALYDYAMPLVGELPEYASLKMRKSKR